MDERDLEAMRDRAQGVLDLICEIYRLQDEVKTLREIIASAGIELGNNRD